MVKKLHKILTIVVISPWFFFIFAICLLCFSGEIRINNEPTRDEPCFVTLSSCVLMAADTDGIIEDHLGEFEEILPEEYIGITEGGERLESLVGPEAVIGEIIAVFSGAGAGLAALFSSLVGCIALTAVAEVYEGRLSDAAGVGVSVLFGGAISAVIIPIFAECAEVLSSASKFFSLFVPVATAIQVSSGAVNTASASAVGMNLTVSALSGLGTPFFLMLAGFGLCTGLLSAFGDGATASLASGVKKFFMWAMGLICALIMGALSLQTYIASARDSAAMRAAKYAATSLIPVVGGTVSGAMATLATGLSYVKSVVGVGALAVMLSLLLSPLLLLLLYRGVLSLASGIAGYLGVSRAERLLSSVRGAFDLYLAVYAISSVIYVFEIALFMMVG
jgi:stage III sporulation protein AE